jgi:hypothetical protein
MRLVFFIAIMFLGLTTAQGQTVLQQNGQTNGSNAVGSGLSSVPASSLPSESSSSSSSQASQFGAASGSGSPSSPSSTASRPASGAAGASSSGSGSSQSPLLLPGEIPDTSTQAASTTATAPSASSPTCPPAVPSSDGGSANLTEIAGASLGGC